MALDVMLDALLDELADRIAARLAGTHSARPRYYDASHLPPGARSWRAARETARRMAVPLGRVGRDVVVDAAAWDAAIARRVSGAAPVLSDGDAAALAALGLRVVEGGKR